MGTKQTLNCDSHDELTINIEFPCLSSPTSIEHASHRPPAHVAVGKQEIADSSGPSLGGGGDKLPGRLVRGQASPVAFLSLRDLSVIKKFYK